MPLSLFTSMEEYRPSGRIVQTEKALKALCKKLSKLKEFAFDVETEGLDVRKAELLGIGFAFSTESYYIPVGHVSPHPQLDLQVVINALRPIFENPDINKIAHNMKFDWHILNQHGIYTKGKLLDTMFMVWLGQEETQSRGLKESALRDLGITMQKWENINGGDLKYASIREVAYYCRCDAKITLLLYEKYKKVLKEESLDLSFELETRVLPVTLDMELNGMLIDIDYLKKLDKIVSVKLDTLRHDIHDMVGHKFNISSSQQLSDILFNKLKLIPDRVTPAGKPSVDEEALKDMKDMHPVIAKLLEYRKYHKLKTTYVDGIIERLENNMLYGVFNQIGAITGRYSSSKPNLQNIPRDNEEIQYRNAFIAPEGYTLLVADYNQIEVRLIAHYSKDKALLNAYASGLDVHRQTASDMFNIPYDEVPKDKRAMAKTINFGVAYGAGPRVISETVRDAGVELSEEGAKELLELHREKYSDIYVWSAGVVAGCKKFGYTRTLIGRKRRVPDIYSDDLKTRAKAERECVNHVIQGSAADIMKMAMIRLADDKKFRELGCKIISQVHDEVLVLCPKGKESTVSKIMHNTMEQPFKKALLLPTPIEIGQGKNWSEAK